MFFSGKLNLQIKELKDEVSELRDQNQKLNIENQALTARCLEQENSQINDQASDQQTFYSVWTQGGLLISQVRDNISTAASSLHREKQNLGGTLSIFDQTRQTVETILEQVHLIQSRAQDGSQQVKGLLTVTEQIEKFVGVIRDISDQTNLLALNAAIEAARAGESGRGFAVVADEVRNLARKASEASNEIANLVSQITEQTAVASEDIEQVDLLSTEVVASAEQIRAGVREVVSLSDQMGEVISRSATITFVESIKLDHINWKNSVYEGIMTGNLDNLSALGDHSSSSPDGWHYEGKGGQRYSHLLSLANLDSPHEQVHNSGLAAVECARQGDIKGAAQYLSAMEQASLHVAEILDQLNEELNRC